MSKITTPPLPKRVKPVYARVRDTGIPAISASGRTGGDNTGTIYKANDGPQVAAGTSSYMEDLTGTFIKYSKHRPLMTSRPMFKRTITWTPYSATGFNHYSWVGNGGWETVTGQTLSNIFGPLLTPGVNLVAAGRFASVDAVKLKELHIATTNETWKSVDPSQAMSLVSGLEAHKSLRLLLSKGRGLTSLIDAAKLGDRVFRKTLTRITGIDVRRQPMPKRVLLWDEQGVPLTTRSGKPLSRYGRYKWHDSTDVTSRAAQLLLEYRYGWAIMVKEIVDSLKAFNAEALRDDLQLKYGRDYQVTRRTLESSYVKVTPLTGTYGGIAYTGTLTETTELKCRAWVKWKLKESELFRRLNDFGMFDIATTVWDIIPYSFVVDMLADVSGYLQGIDAMMKVNAIESGHSTTVTQRFVRTLVSSNGAVYKWNPHAPLGSSDTLVVKDYDRKAYLGISTSPTVKVKLNLYNVATVAALFKTSAASARQLRV